MASSRYKVVVDALAADIRAGRLAPGSRLPTHRQLAATEGLAVVTATRVYTELEKMGLVSGEPGRGTFVRDSSLPPGHGIDQRPVAPDMVDLNFNYPTLAGQADLLRHALRDLASAGDVEALLRYQPHVGRPAERLTVARYLASHGVPADADRVVIVNGAQHGLAVTAMATMRPGDVVAADALTYSGFTALARSLRLELVPLPSLDGATDLQALDELCTRRRVRAVYVMPTLHNPLGWVTTGRHRDRLARLAREHDLLVIEDAAYAFLAEEAPAPVVARAPERTVYVSGLSKSVATGLRFGFISAPTELIRDIERVIRATTWNVPAVMTAIACRWIEDGTVTQLEAQKRADAETRQALAREVLAGLPVVGHPSSYFLWLPLPEGVRADVVAGDCVRERISVSTAEPFATSDHVPHALRLALGSTDLPSLRTALGTVKGVVDDHANR